MYKGEKTFNNSFLLYCALEEKYKMQELELKKVKKKLFEKSLELNIANKKILKLEDEICQNEICQNKICQNKICKNKKLKK